MRLWPTRSQFFLHDVAVLRASRPGDETSPGVLTPDMRLVAYTASQAAQILQLHQQMGHRMSQSRLDQRFRNQLRYFAFHEGDALLGSSWVAIGGGRYVDEMNWYLPIAADQFWVRDVYLVPAQRGRGRFAALLKLVARSHVPGCSAVWSDVDWVNKNSMRAHVKAGFSVQTRLRALDWDGLLRLREPVPAWHEPVPEIEPGKRCLLMRGARLRRHQELLA